MELTLLDWFIVIVLAGGLIRGAQAGAVRQVTSLAGLLVAFFASVQFMRPIGELTAESIGISTDIAPVVGFVVIFAGVQLAFLALSRLIETILDSLSLGVANHILGGALGGAKAALLLSVLFLVGAQLSIPDETTQGNSTLYTPVATALPTAWDAASRYLPAVKSVSEEFGSQIRQQLPEDSDDGSSETLPDGSSPADATTSGEEGRTS